MLINPFLCVCAVIQHACTLFQAWICPLPRRSAVTTSGLASLVYRAERWSLFDRSVLGDAHCGPHQPSNYASCVMCCMSQEGLCLVNLLHVCCTGNMWSCQLKGPDGQSAQHSPWYFHMLLSTYSISPRYYISPAAHLDFLSRVPTSHSLWVPSNYI